MRFSLGFVLALSLAGLQFLAILIVVSTSYVSSERAMLDHTRDLLREASASAVEHTRGFLNTAREAAELSASIMEEGIVDGDDPEALERYLFRYLQNEALLAGIFYGDEAGNFTYVMRSDGPGPYRSKFVRNGGAAREVELIWRDDAAQVIGQSFDPDDMFDPRDRPWYVDARAASAGAWTDPYIFFSSQQPGITVASAVRDAEGAVRGVVGVDIEIADVSTFLSELVIGERGIAMILNENGNVIAHPNFADIALRNADGTLAFAGVADIADPVARAAFAEFAPAAALSGAVLQDGFEHEGEDYMSLHGPIGGIELPWTILVYVPENDFIQGIKDNRRRNIWLAALISLITAIAGLSLAELILKPVRAFAVRTSLVSQGEVPAEAPLPRTYQELHDANRTLIDEIAQRRSLDAKVQALNHELSHASRVNAMGQMATGLAHELSQPLTAITQNVDTAISLAREGPQKGEELLSVLAELDEQAHQSGDIVRALRSHVRKEDRGSEAFDLADLIAQTCRLMRHELAIHDVRLRLQIDRLPTVCGSRVGTAQVLMNLLRNALEAMVAAGTRAGEITLSARRDGEQIEICVADNGPGIAPDVVLFKQFQTSKPEGLGMGLSISRTIAEMNGGRLWHDGSTSGVTRFYFTVPLQTGDT